MEKRVVKIGRLSSGILLILIGIAILIGMFNSAFAINMLFKLWPVILISLGLETLYYNYKKDVDAKYDVWAVILMCIIISIVAFFSTINYYAKIALGDLNIPQEIEQAANYEQSTYHITSTDISVENLSSKATVKTVESENLKNSQLTVNAKYDSVFRRERVDVMVDEGKVTILSNADSFAESIDVVIYVPAGTNVNIVDNK